MRKTMTISMPGSMKEYVERRVKENDFASASEYFRELVRLDQKRSRSFSQSIARRDYLKRKSLRAAFPDSPDRSYD